MLFFCCNGSDGFEASAASKLSSTELRKAKKSRNKKTEMEDERMNIVTYSLFAYGLTAVISFLVMGVVVLISKTLNNNNAEQEIE